MKRIVFLGLVVILMALAFIGCNGDGDETYTVTFDSDGGTAVSTQTVTEGGKAEKPTPNPTKSGFDFVHWFNTAGNAEWDFNTAVTANLTLKAKWEKIVCPCDPKEHLGIDETCSCGDIDCDCEEQIATLLDSEIPIRKQEGITVDEMENAVEFIEATATSWFWLTTADKTVFIEKVAVIHVVLGDGAIINETILEVGINVDEETLALCMLDDIIYAD